MTTQYGRPATSPISPRRRLGLRGVDARADDALGAEGLHDELEEGVGVLALHGERVLTAASREQLERLR